MNTNSLIILLVVALLLIWLVFRQFTEQRVNPSSLLLLPLLSAYESYTELQPIINHIALTSLIVGIVVGIVAGLLTGFFRGRYTRVRLDKTSGIVYSKPMLASSLMWVVLLGIRIGVIALSYMHLDNAPWMGMLIAFAGAIFLVSISTQKFMVWMQSNRLHTGAPQQGYGL